MAGSSTFIAPSTPWDRRRLGKYDVVCRISTGGMSQIFLAARRGMGGFSKLVVLKMILPDIVGEEDFVRMFLEEARTTAAFAHPHIAQVFELDTADGALFMAMEFVQGCTLVEMARACRQAKETIPIGFTLAAVRDTALALHYAHTFVDPRGRRQLVIHRDVAEKNIMVTYEGVSKLLDFGIAKTVGRSGRTAAGMVKGTSGYMSPEQIRGEPLDQRSDLFSLGVVLHECLTGLRLFHGNNAEEGMMAALNGEVAPPSDWNPLVTPELDVVVLRALMKDREARFGTALELARALERAAQGAIWHPEQSGELVVRHFAERRAETRRVLEAAIGPENTGEIRVDTLIAKMKAAADRQSTKRLPSVPVPSSSASPWPEVTAPIAPPLPTVNPAPIREEDEQEEDDDEDDEDDAKTVPEATLPAEFREMSTKFGRSPSPPPLVSQLVTDGGARPLVLSPRATAGAVAGEAASFTPVEDERQTDSFDSPVEPDRSSVSALRSRLNEATSAESPPSPFPRNWMLLAGAVAIALAAFFGTLFALGLIRDLGF